MILAQILRIKGSGVVCSSPSIRLREAAKALAGNKVGALVVRGTDGGVDGLFSERDLVSAIAQCGAIALDAPVSSFVSGCFSAVRPDESVFRAMQMMTQRRVRHLPVMNERELVGVVSIGDLVKWRIAEADADVDAMRAYIQQ